MKQASPRYIVSFQKERFRGGGVRYYWMISADHNPDVLVSWGHAATQELAETAARNEEKDLSSGISKGGRVVSAKKPSSLVC